MASDTHRGPGFAFLWYPILLAALASPALAADQDGTRRQIEMKISLIQKYHESRTATQIAGSAEAGDLLVRSRKLVEQALSDLDAGKLEAAQSGVDRSIKLFTAAAETINRSKKSRQQNLIEIESARAEIDAYLESYQAALAARESSTSGPLEQARLAGMLVDADSHKSKGDIESAREILIEARELVVAALVDVRNNQTLVYRVEFETPADEFRYEQNRYREYVALGQTVLANGDFDKGRVRMFEQLSDAGSLHSREAGVWVEEGDYTSGIHHMQVAIKKVVQGLQLLGIPLSM